MKKSFLLFLCFTLIISSFAGISFASLGTSFYLVSQSVISGQENVDISPELVYGFSKEVDETSLSSISVNNDKTYIQSAKLDSSYTTLTIELAKELSYYSYYTLDLSGVKDTDGIALEHQITFRTKGGENNVFAIESATVADGATSVDVNPSLSFNFNHRITLSGFTPSLNGDTSYIKSYEISSDDDTVLNIILAKELAGNTQYTLNLSSLKSIYGVSFGKDISFTTADNRILYNIMEDDFEQSSAIDTTKWRTSNKAELISESGNNVVHIHNVNSAASYIDNYKLYGYEMPGDVVVEFRMKLDETTVRTAFNFLNVNNDSGSGNMMMQLRDDDKDGTWDIKLNNNGVYSTKDATCKIGEWHKYTFVLNPLTGNYRFYLDDVFISDSYAIKNKSQSDKINYVRFNVYDIAYGYYGVYIDDIKIAQRLALVPNESGEYECFTDSSGNPITELNSQKTVHKAQFVNNGPADEAMHLFLALYDAETNELLELKQQNFTVKANSHYDITQSFDNLGTKARKCYIKAIYVNNETDITPYRAAMIPLSALTLQKDSGIPEVVATYPNGLLKAVTFSIDDGNELDKNFVALMNKYNMKATFNIVGSRADGTAEIWGIPQAEFAEVYAGHELASHSYSHFSDVITDEAFKEDLLKAQKLIEAQGFTVRGYAYPNGKEGDSTTNYQKILADNGYLYARDTGNTNSFDIPTSDELLCFSMTRQIGSAEPTAMTALADEYMALDRKGMTLFSIWGHSHDISDTNTEKLWNWSEWEEFCSKLSGKSDIWYATNYDIYSYIAAAEELEVSAYAVYNPTDIDLWCTIDGELVCIKSGENYSFN